MNQAKKITEGAVVIAVYIVLLLIAVFIPITMIFGLFILPVPFIIYASRHDYKPAILMFIVALMLSVLFATVVSLPITIVAGIGGIVIGSSIFHKRTAYDTWAKGTVGFVVGTVLILILLQFVFQINIYEEMDLVVDETVEMTRTFVEQIGLGEEGLKQLTIEEQLYSFKDLIPSSIAIYSLILAFLSQWIGYKVLNRVHKKELYFPPFKQLNFPTSIIWIYFLSIILMLVDLDPSSGLYIVVMNVMALIVILIAIQGFSFIFFYFDYKKMHQAIPITIVVITIIFPFLFLFLIRIIGIIDLGFSLKKRIASSSN